MAGGFVTLGALWLLASVFLPITPISIDVPLTPAHQALTVLPENAAVVAGDSASFHCASDSSDINWFFGIIKLADRCVLNPIFAETYSVEHDPITGACNLNVVSATRAQEGRYICMESDGLESEVLSAHLVVIDAYPSCIASAADDLNAGDPVSMSCTATYTPNLSRMLMTWTDPEGQRVLSTDDYSQPGRIVSSITVAAAAPSVPIHKCTASFDLTLGGPAEATNAPAWTYTWNSPALDVMHCPTSITITPSSLTSLFVGDVITCSSNGHPPAAYHWSVEGQAEIQSGPLIVVASPGTRLYTCRATVVIDGVPCSMDRTVSVTASIPTSCLKRKQADVNAASGRYMITTSMGRVIEVYCEMGLNGGGYTFINPQDLPQLTDGEVQALFTDHSTYLMRTRVCNGSQPYAVLAQLPEYSHISLKIGLSNVPAGYRMYANNYVGARLGTPYLFFGFLPESVTNVTNIRGLLVNDVSVQYDITTPAAAYMNYMALLPGFNEQAWHDYGTSDSSFIKALYENHRVNPSGRVMPEEYFAFFETYFQGGGYANTNGAPLNRLGVHTAAIGFR